MEFFLIKAILFLAFFSTLITAAYWANEKLEEYDYDKEKKEE